jgi:hypothetical protein
MNTNLFKLFIIVASVFKCIPDGFRVKKVFHQYLITKCNFT